MKDWSGGRRESVPGVTEGSVVAQVQVAYALGMTGEKAKTANRIATVVLFIVLFGTNIVLSSTTDLGVIVRGVFSVGGGVLAAIMVYALLTRGASEEMD